MKRLDVFKLTDDDWHGSYIIKGWHNGVENPKLVTVTFTWLTDGNWRVCVWGNDDFGLERDYANENEAWEMFQLLLEQEKVNTGWLKSNGFVNA